MEKLNLNKMLKNKTLVLSICIFILIYFNQEAFAFHTKNLLPKGKSVDWKLEEETAKNARWRNYYATPGEMDARAVEKQGDFSLQQMKDDPYFLHRNKLTEQGGTGIHRSLHSLAKPLPVGYTDKGGSLLFQDYPGAENILDLAETSLLTDETIEKKSGKKKREWKGIPKSRK